MSAVPDFHLLLRREPVRTRSMFLLSSSTAVTLCLLKFSRYTYFRTSKTREVLLEEYSELLFAVFELFFVRTHPSEYVRYHK